MRCSRAKPAFDCGDILRWYPRFRRARLWRRPLESVPGGDYRIPLSGLLSSLSGTYRLDEEIRALDERNAGLNDDDIQAAIGE